MDFAISQELQKILETIRGFMREDVYPLEKAYIGKRFSEMRPVLQEKRKRVKEMSLWAPHIPKAYGGAGLSLTEFAHVSEELGRSPLGHYIFNAQAPDVGNMEILMLYGTDAQKAACLWPLVRGEIRSCFAMAEPDYPGSNPTWLGTTAVKDGNDYVINGRKWFTSAAEGAAFAIVMAITNTEAESPHARASQIMVPADTPGFHRLRNISVMGGVGDDYASHAEIMFQDCRVPQSNRLGAEGAGFAIAQERLGPGRIHHCMRWIGICERAFAMMCERAAKRLLAPGKPLGSRQIVQTWIAEARAEINAARLMVLQAAWKIDREGAYAAREEISLIKFFVAGVLQKVLDRAIQAHGALGVTDDTPLAYWYRHERAARIYDGADEVHKSVVAKRILRRYGIEIS
ncbi:MAG: acyl-CoA dehydrogenase family protein [Acidobacteria bacterium]|nr:acyl-CoA dehydrogenase family protein [Acidobacteriota bacterium]MBI3658279.1 acyl-CoA dehydrogenase family protein [Acidobacteriota bacterium]